MNQSSKTQPEVPRDRDTVPNSLTAVAKELTQIKDGQLRIERLVESAMKMMNDALNMALDVHKTQVDVNSRLATAEANLVILMQWKARLERQKDDGK